VLKKIKDCKNCGSPFKQYNSMTRLCGNCSKIRQQLKSSNNARPYQQACQKRSVLNKKGKHALLWQKTRQESFDLHPQSFYICYICKSPLTKEQTTLDHIQSRSRHPELRYVLDNLAPCCWPCNEKKGSRDLHQI
jgi:5-methylcytosine-specific restriction endonuclease McrA